MTYFDYVGATLVATIILGCALAYIACLIKIMIVGWSEFKHGELVDFFLAMSLLLWLFGVATLLWWRGL